MTQLTGFTWHSQEENSGLVCQYNIQHALQQLLKGIMASENTIFLHELERFSKRWTGTSSVWMKGSYVLMTFLLQEWLFHRIYLKQQLLRGASEVLGIAFSLAENHVCKHGYEPVTKMFWEPLFAPSSSK